MCDIIRFVFAVFVLGACSTDKDPVTNDWGSQDLGEIGDVFDLNAPWSGAAVFTSNEDGASNLLLVRSNNNLYMKGDEYACYWSRTSCTWIIRDIELADSRGSMRKIEILTIVLHPGDARVKILLDGEVTPAKIKLLDPNKSHNLIKAKVTATIMPGTTE